MRMQQRKYSWVPIEKGIKYYKEILVFLLFTALTAIVTYPLILNFSGSIYGGAGDPFGTIWSFWWQKYSRTQSLSVYFTPLLGAPYGAPKSVQYLLQNYVVQGLSYFFDEVVIYNLLIFISFPLTAFFTYLLANYLVKNRLASIFAGIAFAFSPFNLAHSLAHLIYVQWVPLYIYSLLRMNERRTLLSAFLCALSYSLVFLFNFYFGFFMLILTFIFMVYAFSYSHSTEKPARIDLQSVKIWVSFFLLSFALTAPFIYSTVRVSSKNATPMARSLGDLFVYSARLWEYIVPPVYNPVLGRFVQSFVNAHLHGSNTIEQTLYLGAIPLALGFYAIFKIARKNELANTDNNLRFVFPFLIIAGIACVVLSLPPYIALGPLKIYFPSFFLYDIAPMFRVYARFGVIVMLSVAILASVGLAFLLGLLSGRKQKILVFSLVFIALALEFSNMPPFRTTKLASPPAYKWLAGRDGDPIVAEYPFVRSDQAIQYEYALHQRIHQKRLANGAEIGTYAETVRSSMVDISNPSTCDMLNHLGVKYVVFHKQKYRENFGESPRVTTTGLKLVKDFGGDVVYEIKSSKPKVLLYYGDNFYSADYWQNGSTWNWMSNNGELILENRTKQKIEVDIYSEYIVSIGKERDLEVYANGRRKKILRGLAVKPKALRLKDIKLKPGKNTIKLITSQDPEPLSATFNNYDSREVSLGFRSFEVSVLGKGDD